MLRQRDAQRTGGSAPMPRSGQERRQRKLALKPPRSGARPNARAFAFGKRARGGSAPPQPGSDTEAVAHDGLLRVQAVLGFVEDH